MSIYKNTILKTIPILLSLVLLLVNGFSITAYADKLVLPTKIYYHLDMGVQLAYNLGCDWGSSIYERDSITANPTISFGYDLEVVKVYPYEGSGFDIDNGTNNLSGSGSGQENYDLYYKRYVSTSMATMGFSSYKNEITFNYEAKLETDEYLDVVTLGAAKQESLVYQLFGSKTQLQSQYPEIAAAIETALTAGRNGTAGSNRLYLVFCPTVIEYKKYVTIGDLEAALELPESAKQDEEYTVSDASMVDSSITLDYAILEKCIDSGTWQTVATWEGTGRPGVNTGESIEESYPDLCTITYRLTIYDTYGQSDTATAAIEITDKRDISATADLVIPPYTFEGHTFPAKDQSTFEVDGVNYSATRAYAEGIARNSFKANSSYGKVSRLTDTLANVSFSKRGTYTVTLTVNPVSGARATDTESIEVRKTPFIIDTLSGFQKQNRKQILDIAVATYPGKPITDFDITLRDKKTGDFITLTPDNLQENNAAVKTRTIQRTDSEDGCFTYFTVEFLTKTPAYDAAHPYNTQDFSYQINVEDSKGDTDTASKTFAVSPDLPPTAAISLDSAFLRNENTNIASIKAEDVTVAADGDSVERKWYYGATTSPAVFTDVATMAGYSKLSFGTDKIVGFHKTGVGRFTTKLFVKEVWTEPTLEEYISDSDHLTGSAVAYSAVQNVAPIVSLELLNGIDKDVLLIAKNDTEYQTLLNNKTALQQALLANKIDGRIIIKKLIGDSPSDVTGIRQKLSYQFPTTVWKSGVETDRNAITTDSERTYFTTWTMEGTTGYTAPVTVHAYSPYSGQVWSYSTTRNEIFSFGNDDIGKYLYLICPDSNQTVMLDKRTGAVAGTINMTLPSYVLITDNLFFTNENGNLYAIDQNSLIKTLIDSNVSVVSRVGGNIEYITETDTGVIKNTLNTDSFTVTKELLVDTNNGLGHSSDYQAVCIDSSGKIVLYKTTGGGPDTFNGIRVYSADNKLTKQIPTSVNGGRINNIFAPLDENGECHHVIVHEQYTVSRPDRHYFTGVNLDSGTSTLWSRSSDAFNTMSFTSTFEVKGVSYLYAAGWYLNGGSDYWGPASMFTYNGSSIGQSTAGEGMIGTYDEAFSASDRMIASLWGNNSSGVLQFQISAFPKSLIQETKELIAKFSNKFTFIGDVNTTADQIKATVDTPKPAVKVTANNNGNLTLNNLSLIPGRKYYYEYVIKPLKDGTKDKLTGIAASTGTITSNQAFNGSTLYVTDSYEEDFNGGSINKFFTVNSAGNGYNGKAGVYNDDGASNISLSFVVPAGKQAIVSFDYDFYFRSSYWDGTNIFVDGFRMDENPKTGADDGSGNVKRIGHKIFYKILGPGTHTIETRVSAKSGYWNWVLLDNLVVDLLSATPKTATPTLNITEAEEANWYEISGSFHSLTRTLSYSAQSSTTYYGGLPGQVVEYDDGNPEVIEYYQTIPAGYLQKGTAHLGSTYLLRYNRITYGINGMGNVEFYRGTKDGSFYVDTWTWLGTKSEGTYAHTVTMNHPEDSQGWINLIDVVTYPNNAVTITGNMAFNSSNTEYYFPKVTSTGNTSLTMFIPKGEYLIKNLRVYYIENGQKVFLENKALEDVTQLPNWTLTSGLTASNVTDQVEKKDDDEYVKIYKKGEKVLYNIFYDDYEADPSKTGYWVYSHINWPPDPVHPDVGKVLTVPIDRFYLSGKYTVTHWEVDNTQRPGTAGDASPYDKESNKVELTFYVNGEGKAPWITYIKTNPLKVKENNTYTLAVGVDDTEKDSLQLITEVYQNGKRILADTKTGVTADNAGNYPEQTITGLPTAKAGVYQVICTVSDYSGTGIKAYKFTVVSEGRVTGDVNHTEQWNENRKKYNLKRFSEEVNRTLSLGDYVAMEAPRMRGTNVFWSGERFMLRAETEGEPTTVTVELMSSGPGGGLTDTGYSAVLKNTGKKTSAGAEIWEGSLWNAAMINKWGRKEPEELIFRFTASYPGNVAKTHTVSVIIDSDRDYWQLHRLW